jgi:hypothetical protein
MLLKMSQAGIKIAYWRFEGKYKLPVEYLRVRKERGWSPWPAYPIWPFLALGVAALLGGVLLPSDAR